MANAEKGTANEDFQEYKRLLALEKTLDDKLTKLDKGNNPKAMMDALHRYNEIKDATQIILGAIANLEGVMMKEVHRAYQLPENDD